MGLLDRLKKLLRPSSTSDGPGTANHRHGAADFAEEQAQTDQDSRSGLLGPRLGMGTGLGRSEVNDPTAAAELRSSADREDDGAKEMLIERERRDAEHDE